MLTDTERALLEVWRRYPSRRDLRLAAFLELGLSETRATQIINGLIDRREAWEVDPVTVGRLSRLRASRSRSG